MTQRYQQVSKLSDIVNAFQHRKISPSVSCRWPRIPAF